MVAVPGLAWRERWRARVAHWHGAVLRRVERRLPALTRHKSPERLPIGIDRHRIYVLPTAFGLFFAGLVAAMTLGALNYNNNPALILCFLLGSAMLTSLLRTYLTLRGLRLEQVGAEPVHAGQPQRLRLMFGASEARLRAGVRLRQGRSETTFVLPGAERLTVELERAPPVRGHLELERGRHCTGMSGVSTSVRSAMPPG